VANEGTAGRVLCMIVAALLVLAGAIGAIELLMGATILGNVIALLLMAAIALVAFLVSIPNVITARGRLSVSLMIVAVALEAYVLWRFVADSVPAGYGP